MRLEHEQDRLSQRSQDDDAVIVLVEEVESDRIREAVSLSTERQHRADYFLDLVQGLNVIIWEMDAATGRFTFVSDRAQDILGYPVRQWLSEPHFWQEQLLHPDDRDWCINACVSATNEARDYEIQYRAIAADGRVVWLKDIVRLVRDENGAVKLLRGVMVDITQEKDAEGDVYGLMTHAVEVTEPVQARQEIENKAEEFAKLTQALERSNQELDQFAYIASHDLKAPLRAIANLSEWIEEDLAEQLTDDSREYMNLMRKRVHRMEALIDGILQYSCAGRVHQVETVHVSSLVSEVIELLAPSPNVLIVVEPEMPTLKTERVLLEQIFINLIGNALKYANSANARVQVSVQDVGKFYQFAIADNGPGIAPKYQEKIWTIFQRLEARDKVEGTGVGLSIVKKIVESRAGQVWLASDVGAGATFYFTWPKRLQT
jgi:PAS domain S-box-containing protein